MSLDDDRPTSSIPGWARVTALVLIVAMVVFYGLSYLF